MITAALFLQLVAAIPPSQATQGPHQAAVDAIFAPWNRSDSPGVAVAVTYQGEVVLLRCYGMAEVERSVPITPDTAFDAASLAKQFTGMAVAMLASAGRINLDADVRQLLPDVVRVKDRITLRQLLHHTSGIRDWIGLLPLVNRNPEEFTRFEEIIGVARGLRELDFAPGTEWRYSNTGYNLLAEIVSRTTGSGFPAWTREHIFRPLGMEHTRFRSEPFELIPGLATSYERVEGAWRPRPDFASAYGAGSLFISIHDLARWALNYEDGAVGGPEVLRQMQEQAVLRDGTQLSYAFGVGVGRYYGHRMLTHSGDFSGFVSSWVTFPERRLSVVLLANNRDVNTFKAMEVADLFLPPRQQSAVAPHPAKAPLSPSALAGAWLLEPGRLLRIAQENESWVAHTTWGSPEVVRPLGGGHFRLEPSGTPLELREESGKAPALLAGGLAARRVEPWTPAREALREWIGLYCCPELSVCHRIELQEGDLALLRPFGVAVPLRPTVQDQLSGREWWAAALDADRDQAGRIRGFRLTSSKVRGVRFVRITEEQLSSARDSRPAGVPMGVSLSELGLSSPRRLRDLWLGARAAARRVGDKSASRVNARPVSNRPSLYYLPLPCTCGHSV